MLYLYCSCKIHASVVQKNQTKQEYELKMTSNTIVSYWQFFAVVKIEITMCYKTTFLLVVELIILYFITQLVLMCFGKLQLLKYFLNN